MVLRFASSANEWASTQAASGSHYIEVRRTMAATYGRPWWAMLSGGASIAAAIVICRLVLATVAGHTVVPGLALPTLASAMAGAAAAAAHRCTRLLRTHGGTALVVADSLTLLVFSIASGVFLCVLSELSTLDR